MNSKLIRQIDRTQGSNQFIFYIRRIPLIGKHINPYLYENESFKRKLNALVFIYKQLKRFFGKVIYLSFIFSLIPWIFSDFTFTKSLPNQGDDLPLILFFLFYIYGCITSTLSSEDRKIKWQLLKSFKASSKDYYDFAFKRKLVDRLLYAALFAFAADRYGWEVSLVGAIAIIALFFCSEAFDLYLFKKDRPLPPWKKNLSLLAITTFIVALTWFFNIATLFKSFISIPLLLILAGVSFRYISAFTLFDEINSAAFITMGVSNDAVRRNLELANKAFRVDAKDLKLEKSEEIGQRYQGYAYINRLFLMRQRKVWFNPFKYKMIIISAIGLIVTTAFALERILVLNFDLQIPKSLVESIAPYIFLVYILSSGETLTKAYFLNCDYSLLHYAFYRRKETVLKQFGVRLLTIIPLNLAPMLISIFFLALWSVLGFSEYSLLDMSGLSISIILLSLFFSVHQLFLYYIIQPFNKDMEVKSTPYLVISMSVYFVSLYGRDLFSQISNLNIWISSVTLIYIIVALALVWKFAEKTFRTRD